VGLAVPQFERRIDAEEVMARLFRVLGNVESDAVVVGRRLKVG
jgi:hypothetical protein